MAGSTDTVASCLLPPIPDLRARLFRFSPCAIADDFGVGDTRAVREAITFHAEHKLGLLQLLPINETGADNSPYNAISSVALDPLYLHMVPEEIPGLLPEALKELFPDSVRRELQAGAVSYKRVKMLKLEVLSHAYIEFEAVDLQEGTDAAYEFQAFVENNMGWLPGYTLFRTLLNEYGDNALWHEWKPEHQDLEKAETWLADLRPTRRSWCATASSPPTSSGWRGSSGRACARGPTTRA